MRQSIKQVQNACGYVAANVASQCALLFHTSASDDRQYQPAADHDVQATLASAFRRLTPWNCMFEDACHPMNVARGNAVLTGDADTEARFLGPIEISRLIDEQYQYRADDHWHRRVPDRLVEISDYSGRVDLSSPHVQVEAK